MTNDWTPPVPAAPPRGWWTRKSKGRKAAWIGGGVVVALVAIGAAGSAPDQDAEALDIPPTTVVVPATTAPATTAPATTTPETTPETTAAETTVLECGELGGSRQLSNGSIETCMTDGQWIVTFVPAPQSEAAVTTAPPTVAPTTTAAPTTTIASFTITEVVDGDTVRLSTGQRVRLLGYDTPEVGECGYEESADVLKFLLGSGTVTITADNGDDTDRYGRLLRHVLVNGVPVGLTMIEHGKANARYDSLDGYPRHQYQDAYRNADGPNTFTCNAPVAPAAPEPAAPAAPSNNGPFKNCDAVRAAGRAPIRVGEPGFEPKFDGDNDGVGCE